MSDFWEQASETETSAYKISLINKKKKSQMKDLIMWKITWMLFLKQRPTIHGIHPVITLVDKHSKETASMSEVCSHAHSRDIQNSKEMGAAKCLSAGE